MFALRNKFNNSFMYQTYETDNWGNNSVIILVEEKNIDNYQYEGSSIYVQPTVDLMVKLFTSYEKHKHTNDEYSGSFDDPVLHVPLEEYEIVELGIILK